MGGGIEFFRRFDRRRPSVILLAAKVALVSIVAIDSQNGCAIARCREGGSGEGEPQRWSGLSKSALGCAHRAPARSGSQLCKFRFLRIPDVGAGRGVCKSGRRPATGGARRHCPDHASQPHHLHTSLKSSICAPVDKAINAIKQQRRAGSDLRPSLFMARLTNPFRQKRGHSSRPAETTARPEKTLVKDPETTWLKTYQWRSSKPF